MSQTIAARISAAISVKTFTSASVLEHRVDVLAGELRPTLEADELDEKRERLHVPTQFLDEIRCRACSAAGREQVVDNQHALTLLDRIVVNLEPVGAVL